MTEVCKQTGWSEHTVDLHHFRDRFGPRFTVGLVIHTGAHTLPIGECLWAVPVSALWRDDPVDNQQGGDIS